MYTILNDTYICVCACVCACVCVCVCVCVCCVCVCVCVYVYSSIRTYLCFCIGARCTESDGRYTEPGGGRCYSVHLCISLYNRLLYISTYIILHTPCEFCLLLFPNIQDGDTIMGCLETYTVNGISSSSVNQSDLVVSCTACTN